MNKLIARAAATVRTVFTQDQNTTRFLEQNYVAVRQNSRLWGI
jgi:hypothetical protein